MSSTIFRVTCPECSGVFPVHNELWNAGYELLCPFCGASFAQSASPMIIGGSGEKTTRSSSNTGAAEGM
jgi:hypothetical protein